jgi:hypothetical protein
MYRLGSVRSSLHLPCSCTLLGLVWLDVYSLVDRANDCVV